MLLGRASEGARIDRLLQDAVAGRSGSLLITGEPGIGKTALLEHAVSSARGAVVLHVAGVEAESAFDFAGLHALLQPLLPLLDELPPVQAAALRGALALGEPVGAGRLFVGAATVSLLAAGAGVGGLVCVIDDAQALDSASATALAFAARRLGAEGVAFLVASRESAASAFAALPGLSLTGLDADAAAALVADVARSDVNAAVAQTLHEATAGNPQALLHVARALTSDQLAGRSPLPHPLPIGPELEDVFAQRAAELSDEARRALVVAAAADTRAMRVISRAVTREAVEECEGAGLLAVADGRLDFSHPLVRPSVYHRATPAERRQAHGAIAAAFDGDEQYALRRAWHAAAAAVEPDEEVALLLERAASAAESRRGHVSAPALFERAAALSPGADDRSRRLYLAARAAWLAGEPARARSLLPAEPPGDPAVRADVAHLLLTIARSDGGDAPDAAAEAARVEAADPGRAALLLAAAVGDRPDAAAVGLARRAVALAADAPGPALHASLALARALASAGASAEAAAALADAKRLLAEADPPDPAAILATVEAAVAVDPDDTEFALGVLGSAVDAARRHAVAVLPRALVHIGWLAFAAGDWTNAVVHFAEAERLADETGAADARRTAASGRALVDALQAREPSTEALPDAVAARSLGLAALGAGDADRAAAHLRRGGDAETRPFLLRGLPPVAVDLVEACVRAGRRDPAESEAAHLAEGSPARAWADALLGDVDAFARARAGYTGIPFLAARVALNHGEALRRAGSRRAARAQLDDALTTFAVLGARSWEERARQELRASGETVRPHDPTAAETLTPQELQVARTVAREATYKDAAAKLFLSPKTVEYHLHKVYRKLGITSGRQLAARLEEQGLLE